MNNSEQLSKIINAGISAPVSIITCLSIWNFQFRDLPECKHLFPTQRKINGISVEREKTEKCHPKKWTKCYIVYFEYQVKTPQA
jgi:hypothetical protein